ncbi:Sodium/nucleoside cotransporter 1 [Portunus trituberculatus]|uniref:Sodium/nucleoside cotransporter 1 n=1 Tax=Portunus trituberculatus TaxID=210409 RepID=A0A5B7D4Q7_PORTR|nr:Sodium/nucleoside cotransporter 1 [Portunus trituberculatus]
MTVEETTDAKVKTDVAMTVLNEVSPQQQGHDNPAFTDTHVARRKSPTITSNTQVIIKAFFGKTLHEKLIVPLNALGDNLVRVRWVPWVAFVVLVAGALTFIGVDVQGEMIRLQSLCGVASVLLLGFIFSAAPLKPVESSGVGSMSDSEYGSMSRLTVSGKASLWRQVRWRHVAWGVSLQFVLGLLILRWPLGREVFECLSDKVATFLAFTTAGSSFVFGELATSEPSIFAFQTLPVILFFSFCIQILYYYGVMQTIVMKLGWFLQVTIGTTACESVNAAANIFLGMKRAEIIATYALCGFSNISSIGINLGGFGAMAPSRRGDLAKVVVRAMITGSCACFLTASIAGTLLSVEENTELAFYHRHLDSLDTLRGTVGHYS